jgi:hypothetical protein
MTSTFCLTVRCCLFVCLFFPTLTINSPSTSLALTTGPIVGPEGQIFTFDGDRPEGRDPADGAVTWRSNASFPFGYLASRVDTNAVGSFGFGGKFHFIDARSGTTIRSLQLPESLGSDMIVVTRFRDVLIVRGWVDGLSGVDANRCVTSWGKNRGMFLKKLTQIHFQK